MKVAAIDPGKKGFECLLRGEASCAPCRLCEGGFPLVTESTNPLRRGTHFGTQALGMIPETPCTMPSFWPAPVKEDPGDEGPPSYDLPRMARLCAEWREQDVRLVVLERQAPQRRGSGKFGQGKEGSWASWSNGYGYGCWEASLVAAGFARGEEADLRPDGREHKAVTGTSYGASCPFYVIVDPLVWKRRMGAISHHQGEDSRGERKRANDLKTIEVAKRVAPTLDLRAVERGGGTKRSESPDKAASFLLAIYGQRWILQGTT